MNTYIFIPAIIIFSLMCISLILIPTLIGRPRKNWSMIDWLNRLFELGLLIPILGRIFGWW